MDDFVPTMKSLGSDKSAAKAEKSTSTETAASEGDNNGFFTANVKEVTSVYFR